VSKLFFDTNMFIYLFEDYEPFSSMVDAVWRRMIQRGDKLVTSAMTLGELLVKPSKKGSSLPD
jgi:predicted nucleic acid-binding protein